MNFKKYLKILLHAFLIYFGYELGLNLDYNSNINGISQKSNELKKQLLIQNGFTKKELKRNSGDDKYIFIIGDSYMDNLFQYGESSYPYLFKKFSDSLNYGFVDLSKSGTDFDYFNETLNNLNYKNSILVYSFYINDYPTIKKKKEGLIEKTGVSSKFRFHGISVLKNLIQKISMYIFETPIPLSQTYINFMDWDNTSKQIFSEHISNIKSRFNKIYLVVNFPFNFQYGSKRFPSMEFLYSLSNDKLTVIFTNEIIKNPKSVGLIDGHPTNESVFKNFKFIKKEIIEDLND